ncbi:MAG: fructosamine kinase family protein [Arachnia sp.]
MSDTIAGYQETSSLAEGGEERIHVHQLHMLLVHVVLFGGGYVPRTLDIARRLG